MASVQRSQNLLWLEKAEYVNPHLGPVTKCLYIPKHIFFLQHPSGGHGPGQHLYHFALCDFMHVLWRNISPNTIKNLWFLSAFCKRYFNLRSYTTHVDKVVSPEVTTPCIAHTRL
jgi:hypothetical protein